MEMRLAMPEDAAAVNDLLARSYAQLLVGAYLPQVLASSLPVISRARPELLASGSYWLALRAGCVVGAGGWTAADPRGGPAVAGLGHIRHVATDPDLIRQGIGGRLMRAIWAQASDAGVTRFSCLSTLSAVPFYSACGFKPQCPVDVELQNGMVFPAMQMALQLAK